MRLITSLLVLWNLWGVQGLTQDTEMVTTANLNQALVESLDPNPTKSDSALASPLTEKDALDIIETPSGVTPPAAALNDVQKPQDQETQVAVIEEAPLPSAVVLEEEKPEAQVPVLLSSSIDKFLKATAANLAQDRWELAMFWSNADELTEDVSESASLESLSNEVSRWQIDLTSQAEFERDTLQGSFEDLKMLLASLDIKQGGRSEEIQPGMKITRLNLSTKDNHNLLVEFRQSLD